MDALKRNLKNIVLKLAYDGTHFKGWQNNKNFPTIENTLQNALKIVIGETPKLQAASRTDAGVHAEGQIVNFFSDTKIPLAGIKSRLNNHLSKDLVILDCYEADIHFHPTLDAHSKEYHYFVCNSKIQMPSKRLYSWHFPYALDFEKMRKAASLLTGDLNFEAFCNVRKNHSYKSHIRSVNEIEIASGEEDKICFKIRGNSFLYKMVRNLVGTLLYVGSGKLSLEQLAFGLAIGKREGVGVTAKAHGLTLYKIHYQNKYKN